MPKRDGLVPFKKVDFLFLFSKKNAEVSTLTEAVLRSCGGLFLSQTDNPSVSYSSHFVSVEVKSPDGSYLSSALQLATWLAAGLEKTRQLKELADETSGKSGSSEAVLPSLGISIVGNMWFLYVAAKSENGKVVRNFSRPLQQSSR